MEEKEKKRKRKAIKWDFSIFVAMIALLISTVSAYISFKESKIMMEQQKIALSQKEASAWPFLQNFNFNDYEDEKSKCTFTYQIANKGVGPAIIDDVIYKFDGIEIDAWGLGTILNQKYGDLVNIKQIQNNTLDKNVLAPGENHIVITEKITRKNIGSAEFMNLINEIGSLYVLEYCYCSIYGKCWQVRGYDDVSPSEKCEFRKEIR